MVAGEPWLLVPYIFIVELWLATHCHFPPDISIHVSVQRSRVLERLYIDNCLPLTVELSCQLAFFILSCKPISYCRFKRIDVYIL
jgi:hypothetical protein